MAALLFIHSLKKQLWHADAKEHITGAGFTTDAVWHRSADAIAE